MIESVIGGSDNGITGYGSFRSDITSGGNARSGNQPGNNHGIAVAKDALIDGFTIGADTLHFQADQGGAVEIDGLFRVVGKAHTLYSLS